MMCSHAIMALGRYAVDYGIVKGVSPETVVKIQSPCGLLTANVQYGDGKSGAVRLRSSPCFVFATDFTIALGRLAYIHSDTATIVLLGDMRFHLRYAYHDTLP